MFVERRIVEQMSAAQGRLRLHANHSSSVADTQPTCNSLPCEYYSRPHRHKFSKGPSRKSPARFSPWNVMKQELALHLNLNVGL